MKTTFSRQFVTTAVILLLALLLLGGAFRIVVQEYLEDTTTGQLMGDAAAISDLTAAYDAAGDLRGEALRTNLTLANTVSGADTIICDAMGTVQLCSDRDLNCTHLGLTVSQDYIQKVFEKGQDQDTGMIQGLYEEARYVVSVPIVSKKTGANIGIVMVSSVIAIRLAVRTFQKNAVNFNIAKPKFLRRRR